MDKLMCLKAELNSMILKVHKETSHRIIQQATKVIQPGRPILWRLYALQSVGSFHHHNICLNIAARADIIWWHTFEES